MNWKAYGIAIKSWVHIHFPSGFDSMQIAFPVNIQMRIQLVYRYILLEAKTCQLSLLGEHIGEF